jgi:catecholate siderophore receptor
MSSPTPVRRTPLYLALLAASCTVAHAADNGTAPNSINADDHTLMSGALLGATTLAAVTDDASDASDAADAAAARDGKRLDSFEVEGASFPRASSPKMTQPLLDTPQTVSIVNREQISQQNLLTLREVLTTLPGITFGAGEGGGGYGDSINLRGFSANNDILVDGMRDSAQYTRSDPFNLESVEVINGANSVFSGAGSIGGSINLVSKKAEESQDFTRTTLGLGNDDYRRLTVDSNQMIGTGAAFRINAMAHENDVVGREVENYDRWGIAPAVAFGLDGDTRVDLMYQHQEDENIPQYGVPWFNGDSLPGVGEDQYFGYRNVDTQETETDAFTAIITHQFDDESSIRSISRASRVDQFLIVDPPQGTVCLFDGINPSTGAACDAPGTYQPSGPRGNVRDTSNEFIGTQTDYTTHFDTGSVGHDFVAGFALTHETFEADGSSEFRNADGSPAVLPVMDLNDPDTFYTGPRNRLRTSKVDGELDNKAIYAFDTLRFSDQWLLTLGARYERNDGDSTTYTIKTYTAPTQANPNPDNSNLGSILGAQAPAKNSDDLFSYRGGLTFKPIENASIYFSYGNSKTPSKASVNGSCVATSTTGTANCNVDPESAINYELGGKWDVLDGRLSLTAAVFRNERENFRVADPGNPDNPSGQQTLDGKARVDGVLLGVGGLITDQWAVYANYSRLDSEILQNVSDFVEGSTGDFAAGDPLPQTPEDSFSVWTTYDLNRSWQFGYGVTYQGEFSTNLHTQAYPEGPLAEVDDWWVHRVMVAWRTPVDGLALQLNVNNLFDEEYFIRVRGNNVAGSTTGRTSGWATPGDGRSIVLSALYEF